VALDECKRAGIRIGTVALKVQGSIQGDAVRVSGAKRDTLQEAIALVKKSITDYPVQFENFRE
jgi:uncharacterized protein YajQ (UPF0234 family)